MAFRAGKEVVEPAREFTVQNWVQEIKWFKINQQAYNGIYNGQSGFLISQVSILFLAVSINWRQTQIKKEPWIAKTRKKFRAAIEFFYKVYNNNQSVSVTHPIELS